MTINISTLDTADSDFILAEIGKLTFAVDNGVNQARVADLDSSILREWLRSHNIKGVISTEDFYVNNGQQIIKP